MTSDLDPVVVDAFWDGTYLGNPAAVVLLEERVLGSDVMQSLASSLDLPTTAFAERRSASEFAIRWFTPTHELELCGHATFATAAFLFGFGHAEPDATIAFHTRFGPLFATREPDGRIVLDLPGLEVRPHPIPEGLQEALGLEVVRCSASIDDLIVDVASESEIAVMRPDLHQIARLPFRGAVVTAEGQAPDVDFVSRGFFPAIGVDEDQVCVSAHCKLAPCWAERLGRTRMVALQLSQRGGRLGLEVAGDRVRVSGYARTPALKDHR